MPFQSLYNHTFSGPSALQNAAEKYPYFSIAHFFLLQQSDASQEGYEQKAAKAALHFANPYLLNHQLTAAEIPETATPVHRPGKTTEDIAGPDTAIPDKPDEMTARVEAAPPEETSLAEPAKEKEPLPLLFEPLHTTDYFASQGIKLSEVVQPGDKMGRQLKSFTEWLKTMKKVHPEGLKEKTDGSIDPSVQKLAEKSNKEEDVLTESMAEVYLQQGKTNKAKEIYEKLSLLNPSKNAYFAAKLKEIQ